MKRAGRVTACTIALGAVYLYGLWEGLERVSK